ncbi:hypothetical protein [Agromyces atrinae]|uniref:DUF4190 domain-containing protein n=1 Tax=Agromyces atrinae TaxID=592376 RepID=A0A4V1R2K6_9MICO|nr:hypothetical protein [Agromyces atrinae]NYD66835.1 hypothetical protein [Agromyces atrinae]RXZ87486.1 hypothetical protein ESP50_06110 [Agromyces atrinae]
MTNSTGASPFGEAPVSRSETRHGQHRAVSGEIPLPNAPAPAEPRPREYDLPLDTGEIRRTPTGQLLVIHRPVYDEVDTEVYEDSVQRHVFSMIGAIAGVMGLVGSLFVGWLAPLSLAAVVFGALGLRREEHGRAAAFLGVATGAAGLVFCGLWFYFYLAAVPTPVI